MGTYDTLLIGSHRSGFVGGDLNDLTFEQPNITLTHVIDADTVYQNEIITRGFKNEYIYKRVISWIVDGCAVCGFCFGK